MDEARVQCLAIRIIERKSEMHGPFLPALDALAVEGQLRSLPPVCPDSNEWSRPVPKQISVMRGWIERGIWRISPWHRYRVHPARNASVFVVKNTPDGAENLRQIAQSMAKARPFEVAWLYLLRADDERQRRAMELYQVARNTYWTRLAVLVACLALPVAILAAVIART